MTVTLIVAAPVVGVLAAVLLLLGTCSVVVLRRRARG
ncbi:hypothetical protein EV137_3574 [Kribbella pratensis]|uniref:Uncharacterized protein n=1 Tax=Kribbella pratensis TaxID=2512112 RepID=A0ABY2FEI2_9ACTN|nr:hypothetical protein EV137_3574 [Kribbella pratensis]